MLIGDQVKSWVESAGIGNWLLSEVTEVQLSLFYPINKIGETISGGQTPYKRFLIQRAKYFLIRFNDASFLQTTSCSQGPVKI